MLHSKCGDRKNEEWWTGQDLNLRTLTRADLQSAAIDHSATCPQSKWSIMYRKPACVLVDYREGWSG